MPARATIDSNIFVYAELEPKTEKGVRAFHAIEAAAPHGIVAVQALLEFFAVVRRRRPESLQSAAAKVEAWSRVFEIAPTSGPVLRAALQLVQAHKFQVWDAVVWSAAHFAGARLFLSEDLQNGLEIGGMRAVNPFALSKAELAALFK